MKLGTEKQLKYAKLRKRAIRLYNKIRKMDAKVSDNRIHIYIAKQLDCSPRYIKNVIDDETASNSQPK